MVVKYCRFCGKELVNGKCDCQKFKESVKAESQQDEGYKNKDEAASAFDNAANQAKEMSDRAYETGKVVAERAYSAGKDAANIVKNRVDQEREKQRSMDQEREDKVKAAEASIRSSSATSSTQMWSWLKKTSRRKHFYTEDVNTTTEEEFVEKVQQKLYDNKIPASIEKRNINWDQSRKRDTVFHIIPETNVANPLSCILKFNHVGKFSFVEEKTFIAAPDLPAVPEARLPMDPSLSVKAASVLYGIIAAFLGFIVMRFIMMAGLVALAIGAYLIWSGYSARKKMDDIKKHNEMVQLQEIAWNKAWEKWENNIVRHAFQEEIDGELSRIFDSVFESVSQICDEEFKDVKEEVREDVSLSTIEEMIQRRKEEYR